MDQLIVSVSGVRGLVGRGLTPEVAARFAAALGTYANGGPIVLGRDSRPSGRMLRHAALAGLMSAGCRVTDIGIAPTPTVGLAVRSLAAAGGLQITASHNPAPWNGLKLFGPDGAVLPAGEGGWLETQLALITAWSERMQKQIASSQADPDPWRCIAITTKGSQCKLPAAPGDTKCAIHRGRAHL